MTAFREVSVDRSLLRMEAGRLVRDGFRFLTSVGTDNRPRFQGFEIRFFFANDCQRQVVCLVVNVPCTDPVYPSITPDIPSAGWAEREVYDMIGVTPEGHPDPRRLVLADDWPDDVFPLRKEVPHNYRPPRAEKARSALRPTPEGATVVPVGPFYPSLEEPAYFRLFVEGEEVKDCDYRGFFSHRGIEKLAEQLRYDQIPFVAERICGICGFVHSAAFCQAVEEAAGVKAPPRARYIRTVLMELERIHSHLLWIGLAAHIVGFETAFMQSWRVREPVMWAAEAITGNRKTYGMNQIGGVRRDITAETAKALLETLTTVEKETAAIVRALEGDSLLRSRLQGVGVMSRDDAFLWGVLGPTCRASGVDRDVRRDFPYAAYDEIPVKVAVRQAGDIWARLEVRAEETFDSIRIIRDAVANLPPGPLAVEVEPPPAGRSALSLVEAPRGEDLHFLMTGSGGRPYRWRVRVPTYMNLQAVPRMVNPGTTIADFPIIAASIDPCYSCTERMEIVRLTPEGRADG